MKKILLALCICVALTACGEKNSIEKITGGSGIDGSYVVTTGHSADTFKFQKNGMMTQSALDGSHAELAYKIDGHKISIQGVVPSEYYLNKDGDLANYVNREVYRKK